MPLLHLKFSAAPSVSAYKLNFCTSTCSLTIRNGSFLYMLSLPTNSKFVFCLCREDETPKVLGINGPLIPKKLIYRRYIGRQFSPHSTGILMETSLTRLGNTLSFPSRPNLDPLQWMWTVEASNSTMVVFWRSRKAWSASDLKGHWIEQCHKLNPTEAFAGGSQSWSICLKPILDVSTSCRSGLQQRFYWPSSLTRTPSSSEISSKLIICHIRSNSLNES